MNAVCDLRGYREFLRHRDGEPDLMHRTLTQREAFFAALAAVPVRSRRRLDRDAYRRNLCRRRPETDLAAPLLWLLASAKANQAEHFGVRLADLWGRVATASTDAVQLHTYLQETYHTRILADVVAVFDLPVDPAPPPPLTRGLILALVMAPQHWTLPLVGCSEMVGCVLFSALRERGAELFADEPPVAARVRLLYDEILADELSHVGYIAARLSPTGRHLMRALYRLLASRFAAQVPELMALFGRADLARRFRAFSLKAMVAELPEKAYAAALI